MTTVLQVLEALEGGVRRHVHDLVSALDAAEFRTVLAVSFERGVCAKELELSHFASRGIDVHEIPMRREIAPLSDLANLFRLIRCVRRVRPNVIHAHSSKAGLLARLAGAWCRVPVVYTPHAFPFLMACGKRRQAFYRRLEGAAKGLTAALVAVSEEEVREALQIGYGRARVTLIRNGVAPLDAGPVRVRESGPLTVGFVGRLTAQKGVDLLLEAAGEVVTHLPHVTFCLTGAGEREDSLRERIEERQMEAHVRIVGACLPDEAVARMREADIVVVPSRWEGCPYVVLEAWQAGVPVVAAAVGGVPELVRDGVNGVLFEAGNTEALSDALLGLLRDSQKRMRLAEQGRASLSGHRLCDMAAAVGEVYRRVVQAHQV